ncbi:nucleoside/nucleotide kinase family protein [Pseudokineococcus marinus]|uniref:Uridine kinase n=1 Tax=Pseudokineococcus marinus TaxID=351215 RepID=A0A849BK31_9ACTN|nr:uridine kinase [Pseudokineococcus marinus]NNH21715.1 uridine kinase [Pseudokineococcus marinus]
MREADAAGARAELLGELATEVDALRPDPYVRVAVDGVDGAGKSVLAGELAGALRARGRVVVHASVDGFHRPRDQRHARGRQDPEGFYRDSYDLPSLERELLDPFAPGGHGLHRTHVFDARTDRPHVAGQEQAAPGTVLVVDGIFLHRPELRGRWTWSLWLEVDRATSLRRCVARDGAGSPDPADPANRRYVDGQLLYLREARPQQAATHVVNNDDVDAPALVR